MAGTSDSSAASGSAGDGSAAELRGARQKLYPTSRRILAREARQPRIELGRFFSRSGFRLGLESCDSVRECRYSKPCCQAYQPDPSREGLLGYLKRASYLN